MSFLNIFSKKNEMNSRAKMFDGIQSQMMLLPPDLNSQAYLNLYGEVGYIFACINARANAIADTEWYVEDSRGSKKEKSLALELLKKPNPFMSQYELLNITSKYLDTVGQAFWYIAKDGKYGIPREIWAINPSYIYIVPDKNSYIKGYVYKCGADTVPLDTDDILMFNNSNPANAYAGVSPLKALASIVETEKFANEYNRNFFYNNASPAGIVSYERTLTDTQFDRIKEQWNSNYGGLSNAHKVAVLEGGAKFQSTGVTQKDMDFVTMKGLNKKEILSVFSVPEILITGEAVNRATAEVQESIFYKNAVRPVLRLIKDKLNNEFIPLFKIEDDVLLKYKEILSEDKEFIKSILDTQVNKTISVNEARKVLGRLINEDLPDVEGGNEIMTSPMVAPLSIVSEYTADDIDNSQQDSTNTSSENEDKGINKSKEEAVSKKKDFFNAVNKKITDNAGQYQNEMLKASMKIEKEFIKDLNSFFKKQEEEIARAIYNKEEDFLSEEWDKKLQNIAKKHIEAGIKTGGNTSAKLTKGFMLAVNKEAEEQVIYTHANKLSKSAIERRCAAIITINETTKKKIRRIIEETFDSDELSIAEIAKRIHKTGLFSKARSKTIAQTETLGAVNEGSYIMMKQNNDIVGKKAWCSNVDKHVRDAHSDANFEYGLTNPIDVDKYFWVWGEEAMHPLDSNMSAKNIINCRCCMIPVLK